MAWNAYSAGTGWSIYARSEEEGIDFVLGHALYMKAIYGVKTKNDRIDSLKIARLIPGR